MDKIDWYSYRDKFLLSNKNLKRNSVDDYEGGINSFIKWLELKDNNKPIPEDIHTYYFYIQKTKALRTQTLYMITLKLFFAYLSQPHIGLYSDIYKKINLKIPRPKREHEREIPTEKEIKELIEATKGPNQIDKRDGLIIELSAYCGLRMTEIPILKVEDLNKGEDCYTIWVLRKNKKRLIYVYKDLGKRLEGYIENYRIKGYIFKDTVHNESSRPCLNSATITSRIGLRMKIAGIKRKNITAHSLRHYAAMAFLKKSHDIKALAQFLGISKQTAELYDQDDDNYKKNKIIIEPQED